MLRFAEVRILCIYAVTLMAPCAASAQQTLTHGSITGHVVDPAEAAIPHVTVTALQLATNQAYATKTDEQGHFRLPYLPLGEYEISVQAPGFADPVQSAGTVRGQSGSSRRANGCRR